MRVTYTGLTHQMVVGKLEVAGRPMKATGSRRDDSKLLTRREGGDVDTQKPSHITLTLPTLY